MQKEEFKEPINKPSKFKDLNKHFKSSIFKKWHDLKQDSSWDEEIINTWSKDVKMSNKTIEFHSKEEPNSQMEWVVNQNQSLDESYNDWKMNIGSVLDELEKPIKDEKIHECFQSTLLAIENFIIKKWEWLRNNHKYEISDKMWGKINNNKSKHSLGVFIRNGPRIFLFTTSKSNDTIWERYIQ